jgi:hypothetical protein
MESQIRKVKMLEVKEEAIDIERVVSSYRSVHRPAAWPWIPGNGQSMSPGLGATFSLVTWEHGIVVIREL